MHAIDIDRSGKVWECRPCKHKTEHHGHERVVYLGAREQEILKPYLKLELDAYLFSPIEAEAERLAARAAARKTPLNCGNCPGASKKLRRSRPLGERYTTERYCRAVAKAPRILRVEGNRFVLGSEPDVPRVDLLVTGSEKPAAVWLNGTPLKDDGALASKSAAKQAYPAMVLKKGWNHLVFKLFRRGGDWKFAAQLQCPDADFMSNLQAAIESPN